jgi:hypothetical protein
MKQKRANWICWLFIVGSGCFLQSCGGYKYQTTMFSYVFAEIDTLEVLVHQRGKKIQGDVLLIPEYDTLYSHSIKELVGPITRKKFRVIEVRKFQFDDYVVRAGTDDPESYLNRIVDGYSFFRTLDLEIPPDSNLTIVGVHEGAVVAPRIATSLRAKRLFLVNPHFATFRNLALHLALSEDSVRVRNFLDGLHLTDQDQLLAWYHFIDVNDPGDRMFAFRGMRYWKGYFDFEPGDYFRNWSGELHVLLFEDFPLNIPTEANSRQYHLKNRNTNFQTLPGSGRTRKDYVLISKWLKKNIKP